PHIQNGLEMQVRRPMSVVCSGTKLSKNISLFNMLSFLQIFYGVKAQVTIQCMKYEVIVPVCQNDGDAIIAGVVIKSETMNNAIHRGHYCRTGFAPNICAKMKPSWFIVVTGIKHLAAAV